MSLKIAIRLARGAFSLDVDFAAPSPGVTALFGPSGSGKTSLVHCVAGLARPREGRIALGGEVFLDSEARIFVPAHARGCACVFQDARLFPHLGVDGNLRYGARRAKAPPTEEEIAGVVDLLGLRPLLARRVRGLSGGERQRVALGRALLARPRLLLLDEPLASLDAARKEEILPHLESLARGARVPMLYVSHAIDEVARLADRVVVLTAGRVTAQGSVFEVLSSLDAGEALGAQGLGGVIAARHEAIDERHALSALAFDGGRLLVPRLAQPLGSEVRIRIDARDVTLALGEPAGLSANNLLAAEIVALRRAGAGTVDVRLACGSARLVARVTSLSAERLGLAPGLGVTAIVKSVTVAGR
ncbi:MAG: molybdenum ABC transporter ATP-binding protein [Alphaproteobacteria bacterium]|nr:molybdenum ABC transporter ATP-binding protein [Alphaproteobacteria bacterium]